MNKIKQLSDREHCRSRTGMYLGSTSSDGEENPESLRTAIREVVDNAKDELLSGYGSTIWIYFEKTNEPLGEKKYEGKDVTKYTKWIRYTIADDARGFPFSATKNNRGEEITEMELALGNFRAGSKFSKTDALVGLNGIGCSATNFTSAEFSSYAHLSCHNINDSTKLVKSLAKKLGITNSNSKNFYLKITWNLGNKVKEEIVSAKKDPIISKYWKKDLPSTIISFIPDPSIHGTTVADLPNDFKFLGYLNDKFTFYVNGKMVSSDMGYSFGDSVKINIDGTLAKKDQKYDKSADKNPWINFIYSMEISKSFDEDEEIYSVNTLDCSEGKHKNLWKACYTKAFCDYFNDWDIEKYVTMGTKMLVICQCPEPSFSSQTKERCSTIEGWGNKLNQYEPLIKSITKTIRNNEEVFKQNYDRIREFYNAKQDIGKLKELKEQLKDLVTGKTKNISALLPKKLKDCPCKDRERAEVYITEGQSAGSSIIKARGGMDNIAVMPIKGKILNVVGKDTTEALENDEVSDLTYIFGGVNEYHLSINKLHYGKIIIATDSDSDGLQIGALLLADILQNHSYLLGTEENDFEDSIVYIAKAPLYHAFNVDGTDMAFFAGEEDKLDDYKKSHHVKEVKRYKGVGEINPPEMKRFYIGDERKLIKIKPNNIDYCLELMSDNKDENGKTEKYNLMVEQKVISADIIDLEEEGLI